MGSPSKASQTEVFNCSPTEFFAIISDYEKYPEFLAEVKEMKVLKAEGAKKLVEYKVMVLKTFVYRLWMTELAPQRIDWELDGGDLFKSTRGSWVLEESQGKTKATYSVEGEFKIFVPGPVAKGLLQGSLPNMMKSYRERVKKVYGK